MAHLAAGGKVGRNDPCPCGSGRKYKACCEGKSGKMSKVGWVALVAVMLLGVTILVLSFARSDVGARRLVWSPEHGHYHDPVTGRAP